MNLRQCEMILYPEQYPYINEIEHRIMKYKSIKKYAIILHDKDKQKPHYHVALHFGTSYDVSRLKDMFDINMNQVERIKGQWADVLAYLTHENAPDKYQYPKEAVIANFDWQETVTNHQTQKQRKNLVNGLITKYSNLEISFHELWQQLEPEEKISYNKQLETAKKVRNQNVQNMGDRDMQVIQIIGPSGSGKSTLAKFLAKEHLKKDYYRSGANNDPLQDYMGQPIVILDDLDPHEMTYKNLLKLLDPHHNSSAKSRYYNKAMDVELMILTNVQDMIALYYDHATERDPIDQLSRRIKETWVINEDDSILVTTWSFENGEPVPTKKEYLPFDAQFIREYYADPNKEQKSLAEKLKEAFLKGQIKVRPVQDKPHKNQTSLDIDE